MLEKVDLYPKEYYDILGNLPYPGAHDMAVAIWEEDPEMKRLMEIENEANEALANAKIGKSLIMLYHPL